MRSSPLLHYHHHHHHHHVQGIWIHLLFCVVTREDSEWYKGRFYQECESECDLSPSWTEGLSSEDWVGILCCECRAEQVR